MQIIKNVADYAKRLNKAEIEKKSILHVWFKIVNDNRKRLAIPNLYITPSIINEIQREMCARAAQLVVEWTPDGNR